MASIQGIYIALFGRPADPEGLDFWTAQTKGGTDLSFLVGRLTAADEYQDLVEGKTPTQVINAIYQQLFDRDADPEGLAHYLELLASGEQSIETIAINILDGTSGTDLLTLDAKIDAADLFTASLDTPAEEDAYAGNTAEALGRDFIDGVDANDRATQAEVDAAIEQLLTPGGEAPEEPEQPNNPGNPGGGGNTGGGNGSVTPPPGTEVVEEGEDLQEAIDDAANGSTVYIDGEFDGRYTIDKSITIIGVNGTVITGGFDIRDEAVNVTLTNLAIQTVGSGDQNAAIYTFDTEDGPDHSLANLVLNNVDVTGTGVDGARGLILVETGAGPSGVNVDILNGSSFTNLVSGVYAGVEQGNDITIDRSTFTDNLIAVGGVGTGTEVNITRSTFAGNTLEDIGVEGGQVIGGISVDGSTILRSDNDDLLLNSYQDGEEGPITFTGVVSQENVIFVGEGGSIQAALDLAAATGGIQTIYVGAGAYNEDLVINSEVILVGQDGAVINGMGGASAITLTNGASGTSISGFQVNAAEGSNALYNTVKAGLTGIVIEDNFFNAGDNEGGSLVYFNQGISDLDIINNRFEGANLDFSPLLGIEADDVDVTGNHFGASGNYTRGEVEVYPGYVDGTGDVRLSGNTGLGDGDVYYGSYVA